MGKWKSTPSISVLQGPTTHPAYTIRRHGRSFAIYDPSDILVCITVYLKGAFEVVRRLGGVACYAKPAAGR
jgi:hypothetical protein